MNQEQHKTPVSLLDRLRSDPNDQQAWARFVNLYTPLLYYWARKTGFHQTEADDLVQEVFAVLAAKLPAFTYNPDKTFRGWLRTVAENKWHDIFRKRKGQTADSLPPGEVADARPDVTEEFWEREFQDHLQKRALEVMKTDFSTQAWQAFWAVVVEGKTPASVAELQQRDRNAVYQDKFRVLERLREELCGMMD